MSEICTCTSMVAPKCTQIPPEVKPYNCTCVCMYTCQCSASLGQTFDVERGRPKALMWPQTPPKQCHPVMPWAILGENTACMCTCIMHMCACINTLTWHTYAILCYTCTSVSGPRIPHLEHAFGNFRTFSILSSSRLVCILHAQSDTVDQEIFAVKKFSPVA